MNRKLILSGRMLALGLVSLFFLPACGGGGARPPAMQQGLLWNPTSATGTGGTPAPGGTLWVDPNSGLGGGTIGDLTPSSDDVTYSMPVVYIANNTHPLMTSTSSRQIREAEDGLMQALNGYRSRSLNGGGGLGGAGGLGGGGFAAPPLNAFLQGHDGLTRNARANAKHFSRFHPGPMGTGNPEGDSVNGGGVAPAGRLAKSKLTTTGVMELVISGDGYGDYNGAAAYFIANYGPDLIDARWTHFGVGYWTGGSEKYYWSVILGTNPKP